MSNLSGYIFLLLAIVLGITSNGFLKSTNGFTNIGPTIFCIVSMSLFIRVPKKKVGLAI